MRSQATRLYPFVPSGPSFSTTLAFLAELGFEKAWEHDGLAGMRFASAYFILQDIDIPERQSNQMIIFEVTDLDAYWAELQAKDLARAFGGARLLPPTEFPWGREAHIVDLGGVCWHVRQSAG